MSAVFAIEHLGPFIVVDPSVRENQISWSQTLHGLAETAGFMA